MPAATATAGPPVYAIYCRLSRKKARRQRNDRETVERQEAACRKYAAEQGLAVAEAHVYVDNHLSAWTRNPKPGDRPAWDAMIAAGERREFDGLLAYKLDRFARNVRDAEDLVDLAGHRRVLVDGPNSGRIDLSTAHGRRTFREAAVQATGESDNTSERARDALADRSARGLLLGAGRLYGFEVLSKVREDEDDVMPRRRDAEAQVIREAARRLLDGEPLAHIAAGMNARGLATVRGGQWTGKNLGRMLGSARYGVRAILPGEPATAQGEPILDAQTFSEVQVMLAGRRRGRRPTGRWPLTGIMYCGNPDCDGSRTLAGHTSSRRNADGTAPRRYVCAPSNGGCGLSVLAEPAEAIVAARVLAAASDPDTAEAANAEAAALTSARAAAQAEADRVDEELAELEAKKAAGEVRPLAYGRAKPILDGRLSRALAALDEAGAAGEAGEVVPLTRAEWADLSPGAKRATIRRLRLRITVLPLRDGLPRNRFDPDRVRIEP